MKAMNLYLLTRALGEEDFSRLARELTGEVRYRKYSRHEAESLRALIGHIEGALRKREVSGRNCVSFLDGFYFSYTIAHISKEFDLLKISGDGECVLNIELKSEDIETDRIARQLAQNRYYLSHISKSIYSFTYVMQTNTLYSYNDKGHLRVCEAGELAEILCRPAFQSYVEKDLDLYFRAADYLIAPAAMPEKFLQGNYFLTNQQAEFRRRILAELKDAQDEEKTPLITVTGSAGTGKTLLLFDLAMAISRRRKVLLLIAGRMQEGHRIINERLRNVSICPAQAFDTSQECDYLLVDEANRIHESVMDRIIAYIDQNKTPCIMAYDPRQLLDPEETVAEVDERIGELSTMPLEFTGNIRINRPVYSFLRTLFRAKERPARVDYSCIDILFAGDRIDADAILTYYRDRGYKLITLPGGFRGQKGLSAEEIVGLEFESVVMAVDTRFYYNEEHHLKAHGEDAEEGLHVANNDICYPATIVVGSIMRALQSGRYDLSKTAVAITQTGGQCRASNYYSLIKNALVAAGMTQVPVIAVAKPGFEIDWLRLIRPTLEALFFADALAKLYYPAAPRERVPGKARTLYDYYLSAAQPLLLRRDYKGMRRLMADAVEAFSGITDKDRQVSVVGVVGEIYVKYNSFSNHGVVKWLIDHGVEVIPPALTGFFSTSVPNAFINRSQHIREDGLKPWQARLVNRFLRHYAQVYDRLCRPYPFYRPFTDIMDIWAKSRKVINSAADFGEGWFLPGEICDLAENGVNKVVSLQPFGCIANHIISKGIEKRYKDLYPHLALLFLDFDAGTSDANITNRLHFLLNN